MDQARRSPRTYDRQDRNVEKHCGNTQQEGISMAENFKASGVYTKQAHVRIPEGTYEEEHGRKGFFGRVSHLYRTNMPTGWTNIEGDMKPRNLPPLFERKEVENKLVKMLFNKDVEVYLG